MAAQIWFPKDGSDVQVLKTKGVENLKFVVAGKVDAETEQPPLGFLVNDANVYKATGSLKINPRDAKGKWLMVFNLKNVPDLDVPNKYRIFIRQVNDDGSLTAPIIRQIKSFLILSSTSTTFIGPKLVHIQHPAASTSHYNQGFSPYGVLTSPDSLIEWVRLESATMGGNAPLETQGHVDPDLFWYAMFEQTIPPGSNWELTVLANVNFRTVGQLTFTDTWAADSESPSRSGGKSEGTKKE